MALRRTPEGFESECGRYAVEYITPQQPCRWTACWAAIDRKTGKEVPCESQKRARKIVLDWIKHNED